VKSIEEVKYGEFVRPFPNNNRNGARYHVGPPGYYTRVDNRPPFGENKPSLEELINKHIVESTLKRAKMKEWMKKLLESTKLNTRNHNDSLKNLETQFEQLAKEATVANKVPDLSVGQCKVIFANCEVPTDETSSKGTTGLQGTDMLVEMADMTKKALEGIVDNVMVKIDKILFPSNVMIIDMLGDPSETMILGRPFLATIHARIDVFDKKISLGVGDDRIVFDINVGKRVRAKDRNEGEEEQWEIGLDEKYNDPPQVCIETFKSKRVKVQGNDPDRDGHMRKCPKGDGYEVAHDFQDRSPCHIASVMQSNTHGSRQIDDENDDDENVPLNYYINNDLHIQFGREKFCLVTGSRFGVENREEYDTQANLPFRRRVFSSHLDGQPITGIDVANAIVGPTFAELYDDHAVGLCCLGILQLATCYIRCGE
nr:hypothetical protein [Tanacetum cinerariifolium]